MNHKIRNKDGCHVNKFPGGSMLGMAWGFLIGYVIGIIMMAYGIDWSQR